MGTNDIIALHKAGRHLSLEDRLVIERMLTKKTSIDKIAKVLDCSERTVYREKKRGSTRQRSTNGYYTNRYCVETAQRATDEACSRRGPRSTAETDRELIRVIKVLVVDKRWSVYVAVGWLKAKGSPYVCAKTVYNWIEDGRVEGLRPEHLVQHHRRTKSPIPIRNPKEPR